MNIDVVMDFPIDLIFPNPDQPRKIFRDECIDALAKDILINGMINPITLIKRKEKFEIVCGERRWRAAKKAELTKVPVIIKDSTDKQALSISIVENLNRQDLSLIELILAVKKLSKICDNTEIADRLGRKKSWVSKIISLSKSDDDIFSFIEKGYSKDLDSLYQLNLLYKDNRKSAKKLMNECENNPVSRSFLRGKIIEERDKINSNHIYESSINRAEKKPIKSIINKPRNKKEPKKFGICEMKKAKVEHNNLTTLITIGGFSFEFDKSSLEILFESVSENLVV